MEILPISLNSVDVLKMKEAIKATSTNSTVGNHSDFQDAIMKTAFYCTNEFHQVCFEIFRIIHIIICNLTENHEPPCIRFKRNRLEIPLEKSNF